MAGSISLSLSQQFDELGRPLSGGRLYIYAAGTTTRRNAYLDSGLTSLHNWPIELDSAGRIPQFYCADGSIKVRLADQYDVTQIAADNVLVIGPSTTTGGGTVVDPATLLQTGWVQPIYGTGVVTGFVRLNARTIGNAASVATERANADTQALWIFLYNADANLAVSGGRSGVALTDYNAGKTLTLPDFRGKAIAGLDDMGSAPAGVLTSTYYGADPTILGTASGFGQSRTLGTANLPPYTPAGTVSITPAGTVSQITPAGSVSVTVTTPNVLSGGTSDNYTSVAGTGTWNNPTRGPLAATGNFTGTPTTPMFTGTPATPALTGTAQGGISSPLSAIQPTMVITIYIKL